MLDLNDFDVFGDSDIDFFKPIYVIAHGYMEGGGIPWVTRVTPSKLVKTLGRF